MNHEERNLEDLYHKWYPQIIKFANTSYVEDMETEDLISELSIVLIKAIKGYKEDNPEGAKFHTYLYTSFSNKIFNLKKKRNKGIHKTYLSELENSLPYDKANPLSDTESIFDLENGLFISSKLTNKDKLVAKLISSGIIKGKRLSLEETSLLEKYNISVKDYKTAKRHIKNYLQEKLNYE